MGELICVVEMFPKICCFAADENFMIINNFFNGEPAIMILIYLIKKVFNFVISNFTKMLIP